MGWNTWNTFGPDINDTLIRESADKFVELGLDKAGYRYIVVDDCWAELERDPKTHKLVPSKEKFPNGMKAVADYVHSKGLKFGMYSCAGVRTCANYPGSFDHEFLDAETFAEFGCDFLKYDYCNKPDSADGRLMYLRMGNALRACGRDILFSACNWGSEDVWSWIRATGAHMYRSTYDIQDNFKNFSSIAKSQMLKYCYSAPQCFNDMDMLTVGMFGNGLVGKKENACDMDQYKFQFALWCIMGSPLMLGSDIRKMTPEVLELVTNKDLIRINQDPECRPAFLTDRQINADCGVYTLAKHLSDGRIAIGMFNFNEDGDSVADVYVETLGFPFSSGYDLKCRNVFDPAEFTIREFIRRSLKPRTCEFFIATPVKR